MTAFSSRPIAVSARRRFGTDRVGFPVEFLGQEIELAADRAAFAQHGAGGSTCAFSRSISSRISALVASSAASACSRASSKDAEASSKRRDLLFQPGKDGIRLAGGIGFGASCQLRDRLDMAGKDRAQRLAFAKSRLDQRLKRGATVARHGRFSPIRVNPAFHIVRDDDAAHGQQTVGGRRMQGAFARQARGDVGKSAEPFLIEPRSRRRRRPILRKRNLDAAARDMSPTSFLMAGSSASSPPAGEGECRGPCC
jgi:hypothetical protein